MTERLDSEDPSALHDLAESVVAFSTQSAQIMNKVGCRVARDFMDGCGLTAALEEEIGDPVTTQALERAFGSWVIGGIILGTKHTTGDEAIAQKAQELIDSPDFPDYLAMYVPTFVQLGVAFHATEIATGSERFVGLVNDAVAEPYNPEGAL